MNTIDQKSSAERLLRAGSSERRAWAAVIGVSVVAAVVGFAPVPTIVIGVIGILVAPLAAWAWLGADDRVLKLRDEISANKATGAGDLWAGK